MEKEDNGRSHFIGINVTRSAAIWMAHKEHSIVIVNLVEMSKVVLQEPSKIVEMSEQALATWRLFKVTSSHEDNKEARQQPNGDVMAMSKFIVVLPVVGFDGGNADTKSQRKGVGFPNHS